MLPCASDIGITFGILPYPAVTLVQIQCFVLKCTSRNVTANSNSCLQKKREFLSQGQFSLALDKGTKNTLINFSRYEPTLLEAFKNNNDYSVLCQRLNLLTEEIIWQDF